MFYTQIKENSKRKISVKTTNLKETKLYVIDCIPYVYHEVNKHDTAKICIFTKLKPINANDGITENL